MGNITLQELESHLWESAHILRGSIDSSDYKNYIFGLLFLKRVNDVFEEICHHLVDDEGWDLEDAEEERDEYQFFVPKEARWSYLQSLTTDIGPALNHAFERLEEENSGALPEISSILFISLQKSKVGTTTSSLSQ